MLGYYLSLFLNTRVSRVVVNSLLWLFFYGTSAPRLISSSSKRIISLVCVQAQLKFFTRYLTQGYDIRIPASPLICVDFFFAVSEDYFNAEYSNNPSNLLSQCDYCKSSQPRYKLYEKHSVVYPQFKYLAYKQCLPGCVVKSNLPFDTKVTETNNHETTISLRSDTLCEAYDLPTHALVQGKSSESIGNSSNSQGKKWLSGKW